MDKLLEEDATADTKLRKADLSERLLSRKPEDEGSFSRRLR